MPRMNSLPVSTAERLASLSRPSEEFPRRCLPPGFDAGSLPAVEAVFRELTGRTLDGLAALEAWLLDTGEVFAALSEERSRRYIAMTCATEDSGLEKIYLAFIETLRPAWKRAVFQVQRKLLAHPDCGRLPLPRYEVLVRNARNDADLFREENLPLEIELERMAQRYQKTCGAMTVEFQGQTRTLPQMAVYLQEPDRVLRRDAWERAAARRLRDASDLQVLFDEMLRLRHRVARQADCANYRDYMFRKLGRFDYTPADCETFHAAVERVIVPVYRERIARRARTLGLERLRPWDLACDPLGRPSLRPFDTTARLRSGCRRMLERMDPVLGQHFGRIDDLGLLDLDNRSGKAPGGYQSFLDEVRLPFIFMNAAGVQRDVSTLLHEGGHAFHSLEARTEPLHAYRHAPMEFCEVASMSMEMVGSAFLDEFYGPADAARARVAQFEQVLWILPWVATIDAFQHGIYTRPEASVAERTAQWTALLDRFGAGPILDESGLDDIRRTDWQKQLHLFQVPFYYIEYGIAQLGALQVWRRYRGDPAAAIRDYRAALALGGSRPLPELFRAAGIRFDFSEATLRPLVADLCSELERADAEAAPG